MSRPGTITGEPRTKANRRYQKRPPIRPKKRCKIAFSTLPNRPSAPGLPAGTRAGCFRSNIDETKYPHSRSLVPSAGSQTHVCPSLTIIWSRIAEKEPHAISAPRFRAAISPPICGSYKCTSSRSRPARHYIHVLGRTPRTKGRRFSDPRCGIECFLLHRPPLTISISRK